MKAGEKAGEGGCEGEMAQVAQVEREEVRAMEEG